jgi:hypothetical protein
MIKYLFVILICFCCRAVAQNSSGSFTVGGDISLYYPVSFYDANWGLNIPTELTIGRSSVHTNSVWRGSLQAQFSFHTSNYGHGSQFIEADIKGYDHGANTAYSFIAGWQDVTWCNGDSRIVIWLKGGGTTYYFSANANVLPVIYDGIVNPSTYTVSNCGAQLPPKSSQDGYVNNFGLTMSSANFVSSKQNYFNGNVGIGTTSIDNSQGWNKVLDLFGDGHSKLLVRSTSIKTGIFSNESWGGTVGRIGTESSHDLRLMAGYGNDIMTLKTNGNVGIGTTAPTEKLSVNGNIRAKKLIVTQNGWPDYVFAKNYKLRPIHEVANFIATNKHLPDMPSAKDVEEKGLDIGKTQAALLKKIEELTLYVIELKRENIEMKKENGEIKRLFQKSKQKKLQ